MFLQKAEILRLRLGLASYKVRTGQTSVPLADLVVKPLPSMRRISSSNTRNNSNNKFRSGEDTSKGTRAEEDADRPAQQQGDDAGHIEAPEAVELVAELPQLRRTAVDDDVMATPRRKAVLRAEEEERLTSSALRGGAASGLLSLARGGSAE